MNRITSHAFALGGAAALSMALVSKDAKATDIPDNLFVYGGCCGGPAVSSGLIPGLLEWGMWRTDNPTVNNIKQFNLLFRPSSTVVNAPESTGQVTLEAGSSRILTAVLNEGAKVGVGVTQ